MTEAETIASEMQKAEAAEAAAISALAKRSGPNIDVLNQSTVVNDADVASCVTALQIQISRDMAMAWGLDATLHFIPKNNPVQAGHWQLVVLDHSPQADALGFHDLTSEGLPIGKIFAQSDLDAGASWTVTASHELCELICDPDISRCVFKETASGGGRLYALEVADAPEADEFGYLINGILVSDFVFPSWFESFWQPNQVQFDQQKHITQPFQLLSGGYVGYMDVNSTNGWQQLTMGQLANKKARAPIGSRRERRRIPRNQWIRSTI